ncbi:MAG: hypothetical protein ABL994_22775 [Verrucomicrobiales bacterium]
MTVQQVKAVAMELSEEDRADLVATLFDSLPLPDPHDFPGTDSLDAGTVTAIDESTFWDGVRRDREG